MDSEKFLGFYIFCAIGAAFSDLHNAPVEPVKKEQLLPTGANSGRKMYAAGPLVQRFLKENTNGGQRFTLH